MRYFMIGLWLGFMVCLIGGALIKRALCALGYHDFYVVREYSPTVRKLGCHRCYQFFGMNDRVQALVPWDGELEEMHRKDLIR